MLNVWLDEIKLSVFLNCSIPLQQANMKSISFPVDLLEVLETWTLQMGYPLVSITRKDEATFSASQSVFLIDSNDTPNFDYSDGSRKYRLNLVYQCF